MLKRKILIALLEQGQTCEPSSRNTQSHRRQIFRPTTLNLIPLFPYKPEPRCQKQTPQKRQTGWL